MSVPINALTALAFQRHAQRTANEPGMRSNSLPVSSAVRPVGTMSAERLPNRGDYGL
jgi:hypothetical protein